MTMDKSELRQQMLGQRRTLSLRQREDAGQALAAHLAALPVAGAATRIACYVSMAYEPDTALILASFAERGIEVIVPVVVPDTALDWTIYTADAPLRRTALGIAEPTGVRLGAAAIADVDLVIVPALAVDHEGNRLGRGAGYYDRALPLASAPTAALLFTGEIVTSLPCDPHDVPVDMAITPGGVFRVLNRRERPSRG